MFPYFKTSIIMNHVSQRFHMCFNQNATFQVLSLLNEQEVKLVVPTHAITPRTYLMNPGMVLFLGALARIDYLEVRVCLTLEY